MKPVNPHYGDTARKCWQEGFDASTKYWFGKCTEHKQSKWYETGRGFVAEGAFAGHRFLCPECRMELEC